MHSAFYKMDSGDESDIVRHSKRRSATSPGEERQTPMPKRVARWLEEPGLAQYAVSFEAIDIYWERPGDLDLEDLGVTSAGQ